MAEKHLLCTVDGCGNGGKLRRGMCASHYNRLMRHGDPLAGQRYPRRGEPRAYMLAHMWDDCPKWPFSRGAGGYGHIQHEGRVVDVHRLVCEMVHGRAPSPDHEAAHECGLGHEGCFGARCVSWKTRSANQHDRVVHGTSHRGEACPTAKLSEAEVREVLALRGRATQREIASQYGVSRITVSDIHNGRRWAWLT